MFNQKSPKYIYILLEKHSIIYNLEVKIMDTKRIMLFAAILIIAISSVSVVSASWFDGSKATIEVNGEDFNVPITMFEVEALEENGTNGEYDYKFVCYKEDPNGPVCLRIKVFSTENNITLDNDTIMHDPSNIRNFEGNITENVANNENYTHKTIHGKNGILGHDGSSYDFYYINGNRYVHITADNETMIDQVLNI